MQLTKDFNTERDTKITAGLGWDKLTDDQKMSARLLAQNVQVIRDYVGKPITVTSGFRPADKNAAIGGSKTSQHVHGEAWDIVVSGQTRELLDELSAKIRTGELVLPNPCSQIIVETNQFGRSWIHMGIKTPRWIEYNKEMLKQSVSEMVKAKFTKRLTSCEFLSTHDARTFEMIGYKPYGDFG